MEDMENGENNYYGKAIRWGIALKESVDVKLCGVKMKGKYSFQYMENLEIDDSELDTKDTFWHSKNVTVRDSIVKGEYLGWFSENLTL